MTLIRRSVTLPTRQRSEPSRTVCGPWLSQFTSPPVAEQARKLASSAPLTGSFLHSLVVLARLSGDSRPPTTRTLVMPSTSRPRRFQTPGRTKRCASLVPFTPAPNHRKHPFRPKAAPRKKPRRANPAASVAPWLREPVAKSRARLPQRSIVATEPKPSRSTVQQRPARWSRGMAVNSGAPGGLSCNHRNDRTGGRGRLREGAGSWPGLGAAWWPCAR